MADKRLQAKIIGLVSSRRRSVQELQQLLQVPERSLRYNLSALKTRGIIREGFSFSDRRIKFISISRHTAAEDDLND